VYFGEFLYGVEQSLSLRATLCRLWTYGKYWGCVNFFHPWRGYVPFSLAGCLSISILIPSPTARYFARRFRDSVVN